MPSTELVNQDHNDDSGLDEVEFTYTYYCNCPIHQLLWAMFSPRNYYIPRHVYVVPQKPPPPLQLSNPDAFRGPNAPIWKRYPGSQNFHYYCDRHTGRPALLALHMVISPKDSARWGIPTYLKNQVRGLAGKKFFCVGKSPGGKFEGYWNKCIGQLDGILKEFVRGFHVPSKENSGSFIIHDQDGRKIKLQQPLSTEENWKYGVARDPYYADFDIYANIPSDYRKLELPIHCKDQPPFTRSFDILPAQFFDEQGDVVKVTDCPRKFGDKLVEVELSLYHFTPKPGSNPRYMPRCFIARPHAVALVDPARLNERYQAHNPPTPSLAVKQEVKAEIKAEEPQSAQHQARNSMTASLAPVVKKEVKEEIKTEDLLSSLLPIEDERSQEYVDCLPNKVKKEEAVDDGLKSTIKQEVKQEYEQVPLRNGKRRAVPLN